MHSYDVNGNLTIIAWFDDFDGDHPFVALSNFYVGEPIWFPLIQEYFKTGEHAFAAMKAWRNGTDDFIKIQEADTPDLAKELGRSCKLRPDWEEVKYDVMMAVLRSKFTLDRREGRVLLNTGDALLIEGTYWGDDVWGVLLNNHVEPQYAPGRNWLGTMLMARRAELKAELLYGVSGVTLLHNLSFVTK